MSDRIDMEKILSSIDKNTYATTCASTPIPKLDWKLLKQAEEKVTKYTKRKDLPNKVYVGCLEWHELKEDSDYNKFNKKSPFEMFNGLPIEHVSKISMISYEYWPNFPASEGAYCTWGKQPPKPEKIL